MKHRAVIGEKRPNIRKEGRGFLSGTGEEKESDTLMDETASRNGKI